MLRRSFLVGAPALLLASRQKPAVAVTMDDFAWRRVPERWRDTASGRLLAALDRHRVKAMLFVAGRNVDDGKGRAVLARWNGAGHLLANHTYEHQRYGAGSAVLPGYGADILRCEALLRPYGGFRKFFRYPELHEGGTAAARDGLRAFLKEHGYRNGHVTIDSSDWYYDQRLRDRLKITPAFDVNRYRKPYIDHMLDRGRHYDDVSRQVLGRSVAHTLLVHYNLVNTLFLGELLQGFREQGWEVLDAAEAFGDPVFESQPKVLPAGQSLLWALAKETGRYKGELEYPGEWEAKEKPKLDRLGI
jgi:peptidoglycan-N-acetylglucosamine deacetylase